MVTSDPIDGGDAVAAWRTTLAGLSASLVGIGLARFAYTPLIPPLIQSHWFSASEVVSLGAANLAGYFLGALVGRPLASAVGNVNALRAMMLLVTASLIACAFPLSTSWFFVWRLASGIAGGVIMVLVAATLMPHVPPRRRGVASGAIFLGIGLGVAGSGTIVPVLLDHGLRNTWLGLASIAAVFTLASWSAWPPSKTAERTTESAAMSPTIGQAPGAMLVLYVQYALMAAGLVPAMVFLVDFVVRDLREPSQVGAAFWALYGLGSIVGPPFYGWLGDRLGARAALRLVLATQACTIAGLCVLHALGVIGLLAIVAGTFPPGIIPVVLGRVRDIDTGGIERQNRAWGRATMVFAASQAIAGYASAALFKASNGDHRLLFMIASIAIALGLAIDYVEPLRRSARRATGG